MAGAVFLLSYALNQHRQMYQDTPVSLGVSFSTKYAQELGLDPNESLGALANDLGVKRFRLMTYWDQVEPRAGEFDFAVLDAQMEIVARAGARTTLAIGLRQPRYPECHQPQWANVLPDFERDRRLDIYIQKTVERYRYHPALVGWQLENESMNVGFGECAKKISRLRLKQEYALIKALDPRHPVQMNPGDEVYIATGQPRGDGIGFSIYDRFWESHIKRYLHYPLAPWWHRMRAAVTEVYLGRPVMIHELQAEPWGPVATRDLSLGEQDETMTAQRLRQHVEYAKDTGIRKVDLWGGEWWYWRKVKWDDPQLWETARELYAQCPATN